MTAFLTLHEAAKLFPAAAKIDADTLKRMARAGKLTVYKPGKSHLTTEADVMEAVKNKCRVVPKVRDSGCIQPATTPPESSPTNPLGLSSTEIAEVALDSALARAKKKKTTR